MPGTTIHLPGDTARAMAYASKATLKGTRGVLPVLTYMRIATDQGGRVTATATDLNSTWTIGTTVQGDQLPATLVPLSTIGAAWSTAKPGETYAVTIEDDGNAGQLVAADGAVHTFTSGPVDKYPRQTHELDKGVPMTLPMADATAVARAASTDEARPILRTVAITVDGRETMRGADLAHAVATDSYRLACTADAWEATTNDAWTDAATLVPADAILTLSKVAGQVDPRKGKSKGAGDWLWIELVNGGRDARLTVHAGGAATGEIRTDVAVIVRAVDETFPAWRGLVTCPRPDLVSTRPAVTIEDGATAGKALRKLVTASAAGKAPIVLEPSDWHGACSGQVVARVCGSDGRVHKVAPVAGLVWNGGHAWDMPAVNAHYLAVMCETGADMVHANADEPMMRPLTFTADNGGSVRGLLMPFRDNMAAQEARDAQRAAWETVNNGRVCSDGTAIADIGAGKGAATDRQVVA